MTTAKLMTERPEIGKAYLTGRHTFTKIIIHELTVICLLDSGATFSVVIEEYLNSLGFNHWEDKLITIQPLRFKICTSNIFAKGILPLNIILPHLKGSISFNIEFILMKDSMNPCFILGNDSMKMYGKEIVNSKTNYFTVGNDFE